MVFDLYLAYMVQQRPPGMRGQDSVKYLVVDLGCSFILQDCRGDAVHDVCWRRLGMREGLLGQGRMADVRRGGMMGQDSSHCLKNYCGAQRIYTHVLSWLVTVEGIHVKFLRTLLLEDFPVSFATILELFWVKLAGSLCHGIRYQGEGGQACRADLRIKYLAHTYACACLSWLAAELRIISEIFNRSWVRAFFLVGIDGQDPQTVQRSTLYLLRRIRLHGTVWATESGRSRQVSFWQMESPLSYSLVQIPSSRSFMLRHN